jgi:amidase
VLKNHSLDALILPTEFSPNFPALIGSPVVTVPLGKYPANTTIMLNGFEDLTAIAELAELAVRDQFYWPEVE